MKVCFDGRNVVVTGGSGALGQAVIDRLTESGAVCWIPERKGAEESSLKDRPGLHVTHGVDLTDESAVESFFSEVPDLRASIHCAGGFAMGSLESTSLSDFEFQFRLNCLTAFLSCREAVRRFRVQGRSGGRIVNVSARPALEPRQGAGLSAYTASKGALSAMTEALAEELAGEGIWINAVAPSILDTPANRKEMPEADFSEWPGTEEVADTIVFLASPQNRSTRGAVVPVYGRV